MTPPDPRTITWAQIEALAPCDDALAWGRTQFARRRTISVRALLTALMDAEHLPWANWLIVRLMDKPQRMIYAIFAAEQVLHLYEAKYPDDRRPRKAIEAATIYLHTPNAVTQKAAYAAYAAYVAYAAYADAAYAAAAAAADAAAAAAAADARSVRGRAARDEMFTRLITHGMEMLNA